MELIDKYLGEGEEKTARFSKKFKQLEYWTSRNTSTTVNAENLKKAKAIVKNSGVPQKVVVEGEVSEVMGYKLKAKDKKLILAFIDGAKDGEGNALYIDEIGNGTELRGGMSGTIATRDNKGDITLGRAYGNVSQTWINFIRKNTPKLSLK